MDQHLDPDTLAAYVDGRLAISELDSADRHIDACGSCRTELSALAAAHTLPAPTEADPDVPEGKLGRYHVLRELGRGSMGVVLRAYDPELARPVAIKLLRDITRDELRDEARTLARLRHPNVVTVYDVFTDEHGVYLAMELVDGDTLRGFAKGRTQAQVLDACVRAGRGLAAAHDAGVIHRDFKPENVLCSDAGEVRVSDFGLARPADAAADGAIAGTPAYMAPEVLRREPATTASDQYSYCVTVHEMLTGSRPGGAGPVSTGPALPSWVARALRRGLAREPAERFRSMHELVAALADDPRALRRRRLLLAGVAAGALATGGFAMWLASSSAPNCALDDTALLGAWNPARSHAAEAHLAAAITPDMAKRVVAALDKYGAAWLAARGEVCRESHARGAEAQLELDRRIACLDRSRRELGELVRVLSTTPDTAIASSAPELVGRLRDPRTCRNTTTAEILPTDPAGRVIVEEARGLLDRASASQYAGKLDEAEALASYAQSVLGERDLPRLRSEALIIQAKVAGDRSRYDRAEELLYQALHAAERARDDGLVAEVWVELVMSTGAQQQRFELAMSHVRAADAALARTERGNLHVRYEFAVASMLLAQGKLDDARSRLQQALAATEGYPFARAQAGLIRSTLCDVERQANQLAAAHEHCKIALATLEDAFGKDHMRVAFALNIVGALAFTERDWATAETSYRRMIEILEHRGLREQLAYALALANLGTVYSERDEIAPAREYLGRALAAFDANHAKHPQRIVALRSLASIALRTGDGALAVRYYEQVRDAMAAMYTPEHPALLAAHYNLALAYRDQKQPAKAQAELDELLAHAQTPGKEQWVLAARGLDQAAQLADDRKDYRASLALAQRALQAVTHANDAVEQALVLRHIGEIHLNLKQPALAIEPLDQATQGFGADPDAYDIGTTHFALAQALWQSGRDRTRAIELAKQAEAELAKAQTGEGLAKARTEVAAFLRAH